MLMGQMFEDLSGLESISNLFKRKDTSHRVKWVLDRFKLC